MSITAAQYLVRELNKLGIEDFFGLPGDFNFNVLDAIIENPDTNWVGCTNELNAGYAADGYARIKGYGALVTTFGVGELSAVNAIAGSYAENVAVFHIAGTPKTQFIENNVLVHHGFQEADYGAYERVYSNVTASTAFLTCDNAKSEIDRLISVFLREQKPVYLAIPADVCDVIIDDMPDIVYPQSDINNLNAAAEHALRLLNSAKSPVLLGDVLVERYKAKTEFIKFMLNSSYPVTTHLMGKDLVDEEYDKFLGTYIGEYANIETHNVLKQSDCVVSVGAIFSDLNTMHFSTPFKPNDFINIQGTQTIIENQVYKNVLMKDMLEKLANNVKKIYPNIPDISLGYAEMDESSNKLLSTKYIFPRLQEFVQPNDIVIAETGIIHYAMGLLKLESNVSLENQMLWGSIGWATPAAFGAAMADKTRRVVLITGEGSHQLTACEISNMMKHKVNPVVLVINNNGYTIERVLSKDPWDPYNDVISWNYSMLPEVFEGDVWVAQASTNDELDHALSQIGCEQKNRMCYVELFIEPMDVPEVTLRVVNRERIQESTKN